MKERPMNTIRRPKKMEPWFAAALAALLPAASERAAPAPIKVVTTLSVLADLAREVGGERVKVEALSDPHEDPHYVAPRPTLMVKAREAGAFVELGLQLELWAGKVVEGSGNPVIQAGQPGRIVASLGIPTLELPRELSREWGDVHPFGNPHIWLDPLNAKEMAANIAHGLERVDPEGKDAYEAKLKSFQDRIDVALFGEDLVKEVGGRQLARRARDGTLEGWLKDRGLSDKLGGWLKRARPLSGRPVVTYHKSWIYFAERFGLKIPIEIEEKPGIPPSARHRDAVVELIRKQGVKTILEEVFYDRGAADYLAKETGAHVLVVPIDLGESVGAADYFALVDLILGRVLESEAGGAGSR
jgi:zinc/manganese transport system substrate-binding protein